MTCDFVMVAEPALKTKQAEVARASENLQAALLLGRQACRSLIYIKAPRCDMRRVSPRQEIATLVAMLRSIPSHCTYRSPTPKQRLSVQLPLAHRRSSRLARAENGSTPQEKPTEQQEKQVDRNPPVPASSGGLLAAIGSVALGAAVFAATRFGSGVSLSTLERAAVPLDAALQNNRPSLVEFYADWCEVCRELAPAVYQVEQAYTDKVNFVMLNIENPKWAPEMAEYRVSGIPHFVFLNSRGEPEAAAVGKLPVQVLKENLQALSSGSQLPFRGATGATSGLSSRTQGMMPAPSPRSHG